MLMMMAACFALGVFFGSGHSAEQYYQNYQARISTQEQSIEDLQSLTSKELENITAKIARVKASLSRLQINQNALFGNLDMTSEETNTWIEPEMNGIYSLSNDLNTQIDVIADQIEKSHIELIAMHDLYLRQIESNQFLPTLKPAATYVSSLFGWRKDPLGTGKTYYHEGMDFAARKGTPIKAAASGVVTWSAPFDNYGNVVELDHGNGYITRYAHNDQNLVSPGDRVEKGARIATMGDSGRATGPHLHFEILKDGSHINPKRLLNLN